jgi:hypothetical protein
MNHKIMLHKERLQRMLTLIKSQENIEDCYDFDQDYVKAKEAEMIEEYSAELAALNQLAFNQLEEHKNNARHIPALIFNDKGFVEKVDN